LSSSSGRKGWAFFKAAMTHMISAGFLPNTAPTWLRLPFSDAQPDTKMASAMGRYKLLCTWSSSRRVHTGQESMDVLEAVVLEAVVLEAVVLEAVVLEAVVLEAVVLEAVVLEAAAEKQAPSS